MPEKNNLVPRALSLAEVFVSTKVFFLKKLLIYVGEQVTHMAIYQIAIDVGTYVAPS